MKPLTPQEIKILHFVGQGHSSVQIAYALQISTNTVQGYRKSLLSKFDAKNTAELVKKATQLKIINSSDHEIEKNPEPYETEL